jgi:hypothetical protein
MRFIWFIGFIWSIWSLEKNRRPLRGSRVARSSGDRNGVLPPLSAVCWYRFLGIINDAVWKQWHKEVRRR